MNYVHINECFERFSWSSLHLRTKIRREPSKAGTLKNKTSNETSCILSNKNRNKTKINAGIPKKNLRMCGFFCTFAPDCSNTRKHEQSSSCIKKRTSQEELSCLDEYNDHKRSVQDMPGDVCAEIKLYTDITEKV